MKKNSNCYRFYDNIKFNLKMELSTLFIITCAFQINANVHSQANKISINQKNISIESILLNEIENQTDYRFLFENTSFNYKKQIDIEVNKKQIEDVLNLIFKNTNVNFEIFGKQVILTKKILEHDEIKKSKKVEPILKEQVFQESISGTVFSNTGEPLPGASIIEKGTTNGTQTDFDGNFSLTVKSPNAILLISYIGYANKEIKVDSQKRFDIKLEESSESLDEVLLIGYGSVKKSDVTGAMVSVKSEDFNKGVAVSPQQLLQGKASGVNIVQNSGQPGANTSVTIRGSGSVTSSNEPLYVIDGIPVSFQESNFLGQAATEVDRSARQANNPLNMLNASDIESIDVLKDASATAIYGSRGANGVILITTKSGKTGKPRIEYNTYMSVSKIRKKLDLLSADEVRTFASERNISFDSRTDFSNPTLAFGDGGNNTDWQDEIFKTAYTKSHNLAFSGGSEKTNYRASIGYQDQEGIIISSGLETLTSRLNINSKFLEDKLNVDVNLITSNEDTDNVPLVGGITGDVGGDVIRDALRANPTVPVRDENGNFTYISQFVQNPVEQALLFEDITENDRIIGSISTNLSITENLDFLANLGFTRENISKKSYMPLSTRLGSESGGIGQIQTYKNTNELIELTLDYHKEVFTNHQLKLLAGYSFQKFENEGTYIRRQGYVEDIIGFNGIDAGQNIQQASSFAENNKLASFFGRLNYDLFDKYLITVTVRLDGSSRFGSNNKWGTFPSLALGWKISEEAFLKNSSFFSLLKLRIGYGETGNERIANYQSLALLDLATNVNPELGLFARPSTNANSDIKWETTKQTNFGIDYSVFGGKVSGSFDFYTKVTTDLLLSFNSPSNFVAVRNFTANVGEIENKGFEFDIDAKIINNQNFSFNVYGNFSANKNVINSLSNETFKTPDEGIAQFQAPSAQQNNLVIRQKVGYPINSFFGLDFLGFDNNGTEIFRDIDNSGTIGPEDRIILGDPNPDFIYGFGINATVKQFGFDLFLRGVQGVEILNSTRNDIEDIDVLPEMNALKSSLGHGQTVGPIGEATGRFVEDASFLRLENITIGYDLKVESISFLDKLNIYVTGQNLFVLTDYSGFDPEVNKVDFTTFPRPTTFTLGLRAQF